MPISTTLKCKGLYSFPNKLGTLPEGALVQADNVVINRNDVIEPRRGFAVYSSNAMTEVAKQLFYYKGRILRHYGSKIEYDNDSGVFTGLSGSFVAPTSTDGKTRRIKSVEANGNFYFTTSNGIKKLSIADASGYSSVKVTMSITNGSNIAQVSNSAGIGLDWYVVANDIPVGTKVVAISGTSITLSNAATATASNISADFTSKTVTDAGGVNALDTEVTLNNKLGFFTQDSIVSYRVVWGLKDANNNMILGAPSGRAIISNPIQNLLIRDFNNLLATLDKSVGASDLLSETNYVSSFKLPTFALEANIKSNLLALCSALDTDFTITDAVALSSISISNGTASLKFASDVSSYLKADDVIELSSVSLASTVENIIGTHTIASVSTDTVTFFLPNADTGSVGFTGGTSKCKRIKYTIGKFRTNSEQEITTPIVGVKSLNGKVFIRFSSDVSTYFNPKDVIVISGMSDDYADLNGSQIITDVIASSGTVKDTIGFKSARSDSDTSFTISFDVASSKLQAPSHGLSNGDAVKVTTTGTLPTGITVGVTYYVANSSANDFQLSSTSSPLTPITLTGSPTGTTTVTALKKENKSTSVTNGSISLVGYARQLKLSDTVTTEQLESLQSYYDDIVNELQLEPTGIINSSVISNFFSNNATKSAIVNVTFSVPVGVTENHFYQIYRTTLATSTGPSNLSLLDPGDEHRLVYEGNPTSSQIASGYITVEDITPETFLGANLYTNPASGEGWAQANYEPPVAQDIASFKGYTFYANTQTKYRKKLALNSVMSFKKTITEKISSISCSDTVVTITFVPGTNLSNYNLQVGDAVNLYDFTISGLTSNADAINSCFRITAKTTNTLSFRRPLSNFSETEAKNMGTVELIKLDKTLTIADGVSTPNVYTFQPETHEFRTISTALTGSGLAGKYFTLSSANNVNSYYVWYDTGSDPAIANKTGIKVSVSAGDSAATVIQKTYSTLASNPDFNCLYSGTNLYIENTEAGSSDSTIVTSGITLVDNIEGYGEDGISHTIIISTAATPGQQVDETANSLIRVVNKYTNGLVFAQYLSSSTDVPGQMNFEARALGGSAFYFTVNSSTISDQFNPVLPSDSNNKSQIATNELSPNRIYYSKYQQPEAVPLLNYIDVGPKDKAILRILALRDSLFVFKEDAIYRLSGEIAPFISGLFDSSANITAPDTAAVLNNNIYMVSNQGVSRVSETGVQVISRPIEDMIVRLNDALFPFFSTASFGIGYESDRSYYLFTVDSVTDEYATKCYRYNIFTDTWSVFRMSKTCAVIHPDKDKLYFGASDINHIEQERKNFDRSDYADREYVHELVQYSIYSNKLNLFVPTFGYFSVGDTVVQTQYLTINQFNRLLKKLDTDRGIQDEDYYSTLAIMQGDYLPIKIDALVAKLDADPNLSGYEAEIAGYNPNFQGVQEAFNKIVEKLNNDDQVKFSNYQKSNGTVAYETDITDINLTTKVITTRYAYPFLVGPITIFKSIQSVIIWAPDTLSQPGVSKHVREGSIMFENTSFTSGIAAFSTDLNPAFVETSINGSGNGTFGSGLYGSKIYGGSGNSAPFRTYIPRNSQRCRHVNVGFSHSIAREKYSIFGKSLVFEVTSERAYFR